MTILPQHSLFEFNTLGVTAVAEYFTQVLCDNDILECLAFAKKNNLTVKVLGGGSNVVMSEFIPGLVVQFCAKDCSVIEETNQKVVVRVAAGFNWHDFVLYSLSQNWYGIENLAYIPGHVGAAPVQNIGAYGVEVKDCIQAVNGVYLDTGTPFTRLAGECDFGYRESCFKQSLNGRVLITSVEFILSKVPDVKVSYAPLNKMSEQKGLPTPSELAQWVIEVRKTKLPDPKELPNAGSFFKNPVVSLLEFDKLIERFPSMPNYPQKNGVKLPAGWLIDQLGYKGKVFGLVSVHKLQALVLVNQGGTGKDVIAAANQICKAVVGHYGIELEQEPRLFN
jgi:UDP-N-acetylmuramate dehydrogenase